MITHVVLLQPKAEVTGEELAAVLSRVQTPSPTQERATAANSTEDEVENTMVDTLFLWM